MGQSVEVVLVDRDTAGLAVKTLVRAFRSPPPLGIYNPREWSRLAPALMSLLVYPALQYGVVHATTPACAGVAVWMPSEAYPVDLWRLLRATPLSALVDVGIGGGSRMQPLIRYIDAVHARQAPARHVYLQSLGVDPAFQARGHAGRLLRHMLARLDAAGTPCYLETLDEQNVALYEHFGFKLAEASTVPGTRATLWAMLRPPPRRPRARRQPGTNANV
jgi:GNAT superfamily N-acetyltransferase